MKEKADLLEKESLSRKRSLLSLNPIPRWKSIPQGGQQIRKLGFHLLSAKLIDSTKETSHYHGHH